MKYARLAAMLACTTAALSACAQAEAPSTPAAPAPTVAAQPAQTQASTQPAPMPQRSWPTVTQDNWATALKREPGDWVYRQDGRGSLALFGPAGQSALVTLRCDTSRGKVYLSRAGGSTTGVQMTIRTTHGAKVATAYPTGGTPPFVAAAFEVDDEILDMIAYSRGHFLVDVAGMRPLKIPNWPEATRIFEDCR